MKSRPRTSVLLRRMPMLLALVSLATAALQADDIPRAKGVAPADHVLLKSTKGGAYFVPKPLKEEHDRLASQVLALKDELRDDRVPGAEASNRLRDLHAKLDALRKEIDAKKVLVSAAKVHTYLETRLFKPGPSGLLIVTADNLRVEGWPGPAIKCVLEKTILSADDKPVDDELNGLQVIHEHGFAPGLVGKTQVEREADEKAYLASPDGLKLDAAQREWRRNFVGEIAAAYAHYGDFQGKEIDRISVGGLTHEQGNRQILVEVQSPGGDGQMGSGWRRHAALTVYVPESKAVALRGCLAGLDIRDIHAALIVTSADSHDRDYDATFRIRDIHGPLTIHNAPVDLIDTVRGNVRIISTTELANRGTQHDQNGRTFYNPPPRELVCRNIDGDFTAWFTRVDLRIAEVTGLVDVKNEFGDTRLTIARPLASRPHRLLSESGRVEVRLSRDALGTLSLQALTNCGTVRTNGSQELFEGKSFTTGAPDGSRRDWEGIKSKADFDPGRFFADIERLKSVLTGAEPQPGFDAISRAGTVVVTFE